MSKREMNFVEYQTSGVPVRAWVKDVGEPEPGAMQQLHNVANLPVVFHHVAAMPDVHQGYGATIGTVIATKDAVIPSAVGVDIGCGMCAAPLGISAPDLPDSLREIRTAIEAAVPHGRSNQGGPGDVGAWRPDSIPDPVQNVWEQHLRTDYESFGDRYPRIPKGNSVNQLGTLGGGNHFIELCLDENDGVWIMLHSGSRGVGNRIAQTFIRAAKADMVETKEIGKLPDRYLAWIRSDSDHFEPYCRAVTWAQSFASWNRTLMLDSVQDAVGQIVPLQGGFRQIVNCHHNYIELEVHFGEEVWLTRKGAVRARQGDMGIIPGSMGTKSYIVRGLGNEQSFHSCSHGAGRVMSRGEARKRITLADHEAATEGVECRKDADVLDESPAAYKDIDAVMSSQADLVEPVHTLKQIICVKG